MLPLVVVACLAAPPLLRVDQTRVPRRLVDYSGRERILRGVNRGVEWWGPHGRPIEPGEYDGRCPPNNRSYSQPPVCEVDAGTGKYEQDSRWNSTNDFAQMRAVGGRRGNTRVKK